MSLIKRFHKVTNRAGPHLAHAWQKVLGHSLLQQFTDFRICLPGCCLKAAEEPTPVQTAHFGKISFSSTAGSMFQSGTFPAIKILTELYEDDHNNQAKWLLL